MISARPYQDQAVRAVWQYFMAGNTGNPVLAMPTGTGKSVVIAKLLQGILQAYPDQRALVLTHVKELIQQNHDKLHQIWPGAPAGIHSAGLGRRDYSAPIIFGGIGSVVKRANLFKRTNLIFIDECHLVSPNANTMYQQFLEGVREHNPAVKVVGLSATPYRLGQGHITDGGLFTDVCLDQTSPDWFRYFISNGWLAPLVPKATDNMLNTDDIRIRGGEFMAKDVMEQFEAQRITVGALAEAAELAADRRKWLVFASSVDHAEECVQILEHMGISSLAVHSKMPAADRDANIAAFKAGRVRALVNRDVLTTGFDEPGIDCIVMLRPTQSPGLWVQMLGRGTRPCPEVGKENCLVLDFAGNTRRLGPIDDPVVPRKRGAGGGEAPVRLCPTCATYNHASVRVCVECGHEFPAPEEPKALDAEASKLALLSSKDMPQMEVFEVSSMIAEQHNKPGRPDMMRVVYYCGPQSARRFTTYVCLEHEGYASKKAREWWREHSYTDKLMADDPPETTAQALAYFDDLFKPTHIRVWVNKKYPEIMAYDFSGTAFGQQPTTGASERAGMVAREEHPPAPKYEEYDDIPF